jgi:branched-subunit amino acid aminotransferase/4-amino-4-deoxychorismate lyase
VHENQTIPTSKFLKKVTFLHHDGNWIPANEIPILPSDRGLLHGLGLFETMLVVDGRIIALDQHLARMKNSCQQLGWQLSIPDIKSPIAKLGEGRYKVRLSNTAGTGALNELTQGADRLWLLTANRVSKLTEPCSVNISPFTRNERSAIAGLKCSSYAENLVALDHARRLGFQETLFFNNSGHLCEAATANIFLVHKANLLTPSLQSGCLPGITRALVMEMAAHSGIPCRECEIFPDDLDAADSVFLTSSIHGVTPVMRVGNRILSPSQLTERLRDAWNAYITLHSPLD